jgi:hypothetical protein
MPDAYVRVSANLNDGRPRSGGEKARNAQPHHRNTGTVVIDLKTGAAAANAPMPEHIAGQLLIYAHLVRAVRGELPVALTIFSLCAGLMPLP